MSSYSLSGIHLFTACVGANNGNLSVTSKLWQSSITRWPNIRKGNKNLHRATLCCQKGMPVLWIIFECYYNKPLPKKFVQQNRPETMIYWLQYTALYLQYYFLDSYESEKNNLLVVVDFLKGNTSKSSRVNEIKKKSFSTVSKVCISKPNLFCLPQFNKNILLTVHSGFNNIILEMVSVSFAFIVKAK